MDLVYYLLTKDKDEEALSALHGTLYEGTRSVEEEEKIAEAYAIAKFAELSKKAEAEDDEED